jgi:hypothetical protein
MTKQSMTENLRKRLSQFDEKVFTKKLKTAVREEVKTFLAEHGVAARYIKVYINDQGQLDIDVSGYLPLVQVN